MPTAQRRFGVGQVPHDKVRVHAAGRNYERVGGGHGDGDDGGVVQAVAADLREGGSLPDDHPHLFMANISLSIICRK